MTRRYALRDDQWERIKDLLPGREGDVGVTAKDNRLFIEAALYLPLAGIPCVTCSFPIRGFSGVNRPFQSINI